VERTPTEATASLISDVNEAAARVEAANPTRGGFLSAIGAGLRRLFGS